MSDTSKVYESAELVAAREAAVLATYKAYRIGLGYCLPIGFPSENDRALLLAALKASEPSLLFHYDDEDNEWYCFTGDGTSIGGRYVVRYIAVDDKKVFTKSGFIPSGTDDFIKIKDGTDHDELVQSCKDHFIIRHYANIAKGQTV